MSNVYMIQPAFTTGEISPAVGNRVDLEKYKSALLTAENTLIRPYGGCCRRSGSKYIGELKYSDKDAILVEFSVSISESYLLEVGYQYIRIWKDEQYTGIELVTPYTDVSKLQFTQSADTMIICSGDYPVKQLVRTATNWEFSNWEITEAYYDPMQSAFKFGSTYATPGSYTFTANNTGRYHVEIASAGGGGGGGTASVAAKMCMPGGSGGSGEMIAIDVNLTSGTAYSVVVGAGGAGGTSYQQDSGTNGSNGGVSSFNGSSARAGGGGTGAIRVGTWGMDYKSGTDGVSYSGGGNGGAYGWYNASSHANGTAGKNGWVHITFSDNKTVKPSVENGDDVTMIASEDVFTSGMVGGYIKLSQEIASKTVSVSLSERNGSVTTDSIYVGRSWKIITHGTWHGSVVLQKSDDNANWKDYRTYTANDDNNYTESGTVDVGCYMRAIATMINDDSSSSSKLYVDLTRLSYDHEGKAKITSVSNTMTAKVSVVQSFGSTDATTSYSLSSWCSEFGFPTVSCFFQDRLCFAATKKEPYSIWMSRTGDYQNFSVEKVDGTVTDDSAIKLDLIVRKGYEILHMLPAQDLVVLTSGNEWIIPGDSVVTPSKVNPKPQTMRGSSSCVPLNIGNRIIHVQRSGSTVRDLGYQYESDNYNGVDLTILASHLVKNHSLISAAYCQEPDSVLYFVRDDGIIICLTIIREQDVYGWSHMTTDGLYKWITSIPTGNNDTLYTIVERTIGGATKRYIECIEPTTTDQFVDSYVEGSGKTLYVPNLIGKTIQAVTDGYMMKNMIVPEDGTISFSGTYSRIIAGLPYTTKIEQPGAEISLGDGTLQARIHKINEIVLRVEGTYGGRIGYGFEKMDEIMYPDYCTLYTGDLNQTFPLYDVGANTKNHVCIMTDDPYPFKLNAIIKEVSVDGGFVKSFNG